MNPGPISSDLQALIAQRIDSIWMLQAVLLLHANPDGKWSAGDLATELRISEHWDPLPTLARRELAVPEGGIWRYTSDPALRRTIAELADAYARFPNAIIQLIHMRRDVESFADAFRLLRRPPEGGPDV